MIPSVTARVAIKAFNVFGFVQHRQKGSHVILKKADHPLLLTIPDHGNKDVSTGLLRKQIRNAGITVEEFTNAL